MGTKTNIRWTDTTWNPVIGCSKVSPGCAHCYAEALSMSPKMRPFGYTGLPWVPANAELNVQLKPERLEQPLHWRDPRRVFVNSMSDLFHELVPDEYLDKVFDVMERSPRHIFQVLTKRSKRMMEYVNRRATQRWQMDVPTNIWLGVSTENQRMADERIPDLIQTVCDVRFLSCEPLLGPIDLHAVPTFTDPLFWLSWVIVGGESGPNYRAMNLDWARALRDQCIAYPDIAFFFKQTGGRRSETGQELDGVRWEQFPEVAA